MEKKIIREQKLCVSAHSDYFKVSSKGTFVFYLILDPIHKRSQDFFRQLCHALLQHAIKSYHNFAFKRLQQHNPLLKHAYTKRLQKVDLRSH